MSGHSKWSQIKHKKAATDAKKGKLFSKLIREITVAARTGGASPDTNSALRSAVERARGLGLPKDNIERAIARASGTGEDGSLQEFLYEATAPAGVMILIEGITDNTNRSRAEIRKILESRGARMADPGSIAWNFENMGVIEIEEAAAPDDCELLCIEAGARDIEKGQGVWYVETEFSAMDAVRRELEARGIAVKSADRDYKPKNTVALDNETRERTEALLETLSDHDDVQDVYSNLEGQ